MRVAFLGNAVWSVPAVRALAASPHDLEVFTRVPKPAGRGGRLRPTPVAVAARELGVLLREIETVKRPSGSAELAGSRPDVLAVVAYGEILPPEVLDIPSIAPVNVHFSLLPELRGAAPVQRAILDGLTATGVTTIRMDEGMDTGPILVGAEEAIDPEEDAGSLGDRLAKMGARLLVDTLDRLEAGSLHEKPQDEGRATYAPKLRPEDETIDWSQPADRIVRLVRALSPTPAAHTTFRGRLLKVFRAERAEARPEEGASPGGPGAIALASDTRLAVTTGEGVVRLEEVAPEGKRRMSGADFVRGYRPEHGERLGDRHG